MPPAFPRRRSWRCVRWGSAARTPARPRMPRAEGPAVTAPLAPKIHRYSDTPTNATISGLNRRTFAAQHARCLPEHSSRLSVSMPGVSRATRLVMPKPHSGKPVVCAPVDWLGHELRFKQQLPEPVGVAGEVMAGFRGADARIDADKQHAHARLNAVSQLAPSGVERHVRTRAAHGRRRRASARRRRSSSGESASSAVRRRSDTDCSARSPAIAAWR